jgi:hypothetical protein
MKQVEARNPLQFSPILADDDEQDTYIEMAKL